MSKRLFYRLVWIPSALALIVTVVFFVRQPLAIAYPLMQTPYTTSDKSISIEHPLNWKPHTVESHSVMTQVTFAPGGNVRFVVTSDLQGALMADLLKSTGSANLPSDLGGQLPGGAGALPGMEGQAPGSESRPSAPQQSPLAKLHANTAGDFAKEFTDYKENPAVTTQISGMEAMISDFTFTAGQTFFTREMIGKRATILSNDRRVTILATCPKDARKVIFPTFTKMIDSLRVGQTGG